MHGVDPRPEKPAYLKPTNVGFPFESELLARIVPNRSNVPPGFGLLFSPTDLTYIRRVWPFGQPAVGTRAAHG